MFGSRILIFLPLAHAYNFSPNSDSFITVREMASKFSRLTAVKLSFIQVDSSLESKNLMLNSDLAKVIYSGDTVSRFKVA